MEKAFWDVVAVSMRGDTRLQLSGQPGKGSQGSIARVSSNRVERRNK